VRALPLVERKRRLACITPRVESRLMFLDAIRARGTRLYELACERYLEGIVAKWARGTYQCEGRGTSWLKIKNPGYSQTEGRHELFASNRPEWRSHRRKASAPLRSHYVRHSVRRCMTTGKRSNKHRCVRTLSRERHLRS
jgi:hypothetical protein